MGPVREAESSAANVASVLVCQQMPMAAPEEPGRTAARPPRWRASRLTDAEIVRRAKLREGEAKRREAERRKDPAFERGLAMLAHADPELKV